MLNKTKFYNLKEKSKTTRDNTKKVVTSPPDIVDMQEMRKDAYYIIKNMHVKPLNGTLKHVP